MVVTAGYLSNLYIKTADFRHIVCHSLLPNAKLSEVVVYKHAASHNTFQIKLTAPNVNLTDGLFLVGPLVFALIHKIQIITH